MFEALTAFAGGREAPDDPKTHGRKPFWKR